MTRHFFQWRSLKTRVVLLTLAIFVTSTWTLAFYVSENLHRDLQRLLEKQQFSTVTVKADELNRELGERLSALGRIASQLTSVRVSESETMPSFLEARAVLLSQFNGGVLVLRMDGTVIVDTPPPGVRVGVNYMTVDGVPPALIDGRSTIGRPFVDTVRQVPVFAMTVPIRDEQGFIVGALVGLTILNQRNFLDQVTESYYGRSGYYVLVDPESRTIVTATGRVRYMDALPPPGSNSLLDRFVQGSDETGVTTDGPDLEILASAKRVPIAGWFLVAALPTDEAFALIGNMKRYTVEGALFLTVLAGSLTWWMIRRELAPMLSAVTTLAALSDAPQSKTVIPVAIHDEVGTLIDGFNRLLEVLNQRETALRESEERFKALHNASFGGIAIHEQGTILDCNQGLSTLTGYSPEELIGMNGIELIAPEWRDRVAQNIRDGFERAYDAEGVRKDGTRYHLSIHGRNIPYKGRVVRVSEFRDITQRKQMEEQARQLALHDTLTGLPNRRLLNDRLTQSMAASMRSVCYGALMFLDLDNFKPLNDLHGHGIGDLLLMEVAVRLRRCVREADTVARFGGDEFVVMLGELSTSRTESEEQARNVAEKIRSVLSETYRLPLARDGKVDAVVEHHCTVSIGVTLFIGREAGEDDILRQADQAMYQAKEAGRDSVRFFAPA